MFAQTKFELIKKKYGRCASWAIWADEGEKPKDNVGDLSIFDIRHNADLLQQLNPDVILVGLNVSGRIESPLSNFHSASPHAMDFKIRYALKGTVLWGAYMTDIIKDFEQKASGEMMAYLRKNKGFEKENVEVFATELRDLGVFQPTLIAFGRDAFQILDRNLEDTYNIWKVPHYSDYTGKEMYREQIAAIIRSKANQPNRAKMDN